MGAPRKLTWEQFKAARELRARGKKIREIIEELNLDLTFQHLRSILYRAQKGRAYVTKYQWTGKQKLRPFEVKEIRQLLRLGWTNEQIAVRYHVTAYTINDIRLGRSWKALA